MMMMIVIMLPSGCLYFEVAVPDDCWPAEGSHRAAQTDGRQWSDCLAPQKECMCLLHCVQDGARGPVSQCHAVQDAFGSGEERHDCTTYDQEEYFSQYADSEAGASLSWLLREWEWAPLYQLANWAEKHTRHQTTPHSRYLCWLCYSRRLCFSFGTCSL